MRLFISEFKLLVGCSIRMINVLLTVLLEYPNYFIFTLALLFSGAFTQFLNYTKFALTISKLFPLRYYTIARSGVYKSMARYVLAIFFMPQHFRTHAPSAGIPNSCSLRS